jgi:hypothetical protein
MKWSTMSARDRRAVTIGGSILAASFLFIWGVRPYRDALTEARDQLETERATLARERAAVTTAQKNPQLQHVADSVMRTMGPRLFVGKDDVMASAELAAYLGDIASQARVWLQDAGTRPAITSAEGVRTLRVEIRAESDLLGTLLFIQGLERGYKLVRIDRLDISKSARADAQDTEVLSIAATISGFAVGDGQATSGTPAPRPSVTASQANGSLGSIPR